MAEWQDAVVVQAGMGGGITTAALAAAVSAAGGHAPHRVLVNDAVRRWRRAERVLGPLQAATAPLLGRAPARLQGALLRTQHPAVPLFSPAPLTAGEPDRLLEASALYAGETVARIHDVRPAGDVTRDLIP